MKRGPSQYEEGGGEEDVLVHDEDHEAVARASVAVDDDPEETMGRETVGRTRRGRNKDSRPGRVSEEFATVLEEFESAVSGAVEVFRVTVFILRETLTRTRTVSSGLSEGVKILSLVLKLEGRPQGSANQLWTVS